MIVDQQDFVGFAFEQLTVDNATAEGISAANLTEDLDGIEVPARRVHITTDESIRVKWDGSDPAPAEGVIILGASSSLVVPFVLTGAENVKNLRIICAGGTPAKVDIMIER